MRKKREKNSQTEKKKETLNDYPPELRGFSNNRFGGHKATRLRTYGGKFGPASKCRNLSPEECKIIEAQLKKEGKLLR
jgi:hypothetical protein